MNYYRNYRCELNFDPDTGVLRVDYDTEASPFVEKLLKRENLVSAHFTDYSAIRDVEYQAHSNELSNVFSSQNMCSDIGIKQDPYLSESLSDSDICSELSTHNSPDASYPATAVALRSPFATPSSAPMNFSPDTLAATTTQAGQYFVIRTLLDELQQLPCKTLVKALLRVAIPAKKIRYPYKHGENARPEFWPEGVPHRQPDHMSKAHRIDLIHYLITHMPYAQVAEVFYVFRANLIPSKQHLIDSLLASLRVSSGQQAAIEQ